MKIACSSVLPIPINNPAVETQPSGRRLGTGVPSQQIQRSFSFPVRDLVNRKIFVLHPWLSMFMPQDG